jgi:hypothetical protein
VELEAAGGAAGRLDPLGVKSGRNLLEGAPAGVQGLGRGRAAGLDPQLEQGGIGHGRGRPGPGHGDGGPAARDTFPVRDESLARGGSLRWGGFLLGHVGSSHGPVVGQLPPASRRPFNRAGPAFVRSAQDQDRPARSRQ